MDTATLQPAKPGAHVQVVTPSGTTEKQLLILGGDSTLGRDEFLRVLYGAQVSLEVGVRATVPLITLGLLSARSPAFWAGGPTVRSRA